MGDSNLINFEFFICDLGKFIFGGKLGIIYFIILKFGYFSY